MTGNRVAVVTHVFPATSETFVVDHVLGLVQHGFQVQVIADRLEPGLPDVLRAGAGALEARALTARPGGPVATARAAAALAWALARAPRLARTPMGRSFLVRVPALARALEAAAPDLVHAHFASNGVTAALALGDRAPLLVDLHGWDLTALPRLLGWPALRGPLCRAQLVVHSAFAAERVARGLGRSPHLVQLGVNLAQFGAAPRGHTWPSPLRLLVVARLVRQKGVHVAVEAVARLRSEAPALPVTLRVVGEGRERPALEAQARAAGLSEDAVGFVGALPARAVAEEMRRADVLLVPSVEGDDGWIEAFGRVVLEGLAAGLPVVASATGGLPEATGGAGLLVAPASPAALADGVRAVLREPPGVWGERGRVRAAEVSLDRMWREYAERTRAALSP